MASSIVRGMRDPDTRQHLIATYVGRVIVWWQEEVDNLGTVQWHATAWALDASEDNLLRGWVVGPLTADEMLVVRRLRWIESVVRAAKDEKTWLGSDEERARVLALDENRPLLPWDREADLVTYVIRRFRRLSLVQRQRIARWASEEETYAWLRDGRVVKVPVLVRNSAANTAAFDWQQRTVQENRAQNLLPDTRLAAWVASSGCPGFYDGGLDSEESP